MKNFCQVLLCILPITFCFAQVQIGSDLNGFLPDDDFGYDVSLSTDGLRFAVGAPGDIIGQDPGYVQVFGFNGTDWVQIGQTITGLQPYNNAGGSLALSGNGNRLVLGAIYNNNGVQSGAVLVYELMGNEWVQMGNGIGAIPNLMTVGQDVAISRDGNIVALTTTMVASISEVTGRVDVYEWNGNAWIRKGETFQPTETFDLYGYSLDLSDDGSRIAIGAANGRPDMVQNASGFAQVFEFSNGQWQQLGSNLDALYLIGGFGSDVSLSGDGQRVIVFGPAITNGLNFVGTIRAFDYNGTTWELVGNELIGVDNFDRFGEGIKLSQDGNHFVFGAYTENENRGCVSKYSLIDNEWVFQGEKICGDTELDLFGFNVDISGDGNTIIAGARVNEDPGIKSGYAQLWSYEVSSSISPLESKKILVYPNPTQEILYFDIPEDQTEYIRVYDTNNRLLINKNIHTQKFLNVGELPEGLFILEIGGKDKTYNSRFIKTK